MMKAEMRVQETNIHGEPGTDALSQHAPCSLLGYPLPAVNNCCKITNLL